MHCQRVTLQAITTTPDKGKRKFEGTGEGGMLWRNFEIARSETLFDNPQAMESQLNELRAADSKLVEACLDHDPPALEELRHKHLFALRSLLIRRGANPTEADDLIDGLWADCAVGRGDRAPLLERFNCKCSLHNWLATVATHLLYDQLRRKKFRAEPQLNKEERIEEMLERLGAIVDRPAESDLTKLLLASLQYAFAACPPEEHLMIRLIYFHGFSQRDLCRMWHWSEAKVSRRLSAAMDAIRTATLAHLSKADAGLKLVWDDFQELCHTQQLGFL
jgi:RNA polymerase sigma factor (sigma-70 family)